MQTDVHTNPNAGHWGLWLRDPDGYLVRAATVDEHDGRVANLVAEDS